jgi:hypothetical protein
MDGLFGYGRRWVAQRAAIDEKDSTCVCAQPFLYKLVPFTCQRLAVYDEIPTINWPCQQKALILAIRAACIGSISSNQAPMKFAEFYRICIVVLFRRTDRAAELYPSNHF